MYGMCEMSVRVFCTCVHVCMYVFMHVCMYAFMPIDIYVHLSLSVRVHVCIFLCMHVCMHARMHAFMDVYMYGCMYVRMCTCAGTHGLCACPLQKCKYAGSQSVGLSSRIGILVHVHVFG